MMFWKWVVSVTLASVSGTCFGSDWQLVSSDAKSDFYIDAASIRNPEVS